MKGKLLKNEDLINYNNKKVYVEFEVNPALMTCCGDFKDHIKRCEEIQNRM